MNQTAPATNGSLTRLGGSLGIAACCIGLAIFVIACFGFGQAFSFSFLPLLISLGGLVLTVAGGILKHGGTEETGVLAGLFLNFMAILGSLFEMAVCYGWMDMIPGPHPGA